jgi:hypothetical protein
MHAVLGKRLIITGVPAQRFSRAGRSNKPGAEVLNPDMSCGQHDCPRYWIKMVELSFVSTHLDHPSEGERLARSIACWNSWGQGREPQTCHRAGDLNACRPAQFCSSSTVMDQYHRPGAVLISSGKPNRQIDYVLCRPASQLRVVSKVLQSDASIFRFWSCWS